MSNDDPLKIVAVLNFISGSIYLILTIVALTSTFVPLLYRLSLHGKSRTLYVSSDKTSNKTLSLYAFSTSKLFQVHKSRFLHFYLIGLFVSWSLLYFMLTSQSTNTTAQRPFVTLSLIPFSLLILHLLRRSYECIFVHIWSDTGYMHVCGYLLGLLHYLLLPFVFIQSIEIKRDSFLLSFIPHYTLNNNKTCSSYIDLNLSQSTFKTHHYEWITWMGILLNILGQVEQHVHHKMLAQCRSRFDPKTETSCSYKIPTGRWFDQITCPHYLAEIIIYFSFYILLDPPQVQVMGSSNDFIHDSSCIEGYDTLSTTDISSFVLIPWIWTLVFRIYHYKALALLTWVFVNLALSARINHTYYLDCFQSQYPPKRKRLIPFIW
jgi:3-oxo-5-alpha-steroid 4-dehydrogenase 3